MWWYLTMIGASESDGLVPDEDIASGRAVPGWTLGDENAHKPDVFVGRLDPHEPDPTRAIRRLAFGGDLPVTADQAHRWARDLVANEIAAQHRARGTADGAEVRPVDPGVDTLDSGHRAAYLAGYAAGTGVRVEVTRSEGWRDYTSTEGGSVAYWVARLSAQTGTVPVDDGECVRIPGSPGPYSSGPSYRVRPLASPSVLTLPPGGGVIVST